MFSSGFSNSLMRPYITKDECDSPGWILADNMTAFLCISTWFYLVTLFVILSNGTFSPPSDSHIFYTTRMLLNSGDVDNYFISFSSFEYVYGMAYAKNTSMFGLLKLYLNWS